MDPASLHAKHTDVVNESNKAFSDKQAQRRPLQNQNIDISNPKLNTIMRQDMATQIGEHLGNHQLASALHQKGCTANRLQMKEQPSKDDKQQPQSKIYKIQLESGTVHVSEEEYQRFRSSAIHNMGLNFTLVESLARNGKESHLKYMENIHGWTGVISDIVAGADPPSVSIWRAPNSAIKAGRSALKAGNLRSAAQKLELAEEALKKAQAIWTNYIDKTIGGAETTISALETTRNVSFAVAIGSATVLTGGAASAAGVGLLGESALAGGVGLIGGAVKETATQSGEILADLRQKVDVTKILQEAGSEGVSNLAGALIGGPLTDKFHQVFGFHLTNISPELLEYLGRINNLPGPLPSDYFMTKGQKEILEFFAGVGAKPLTSAIQTAADKLSGKTEKLPTLEEFLKQISIQLVEDGVIDLIIDSHVTMPNGSF